MITPLSLRLTLPRRWTSGAEGTFAAHYVGWRVLFLLSGICLHTVMGPFLALPHIL